MVGPPPLTGLKVLEFAGLAPGPFAGLLLADAGASVLRIDRAIPGKTHTPGSAPEPTEDMLARHKSSIAVDLKNPRGVALVRELARHADVVIDPFRPGVLEKLGLGPEVLCAANPRLIFGRMTGFRRDGRYRNMAGHDINYLAVAGVLGLLGRSGEKPTPPWNILGDFAGGGAVLFQGVLMAVVAREKTGRGQVVEANMVDGSAYLATFPRFALKTPLGDQPRGQNLLDTGCPYYDTYETKDGKYMAVGAIEPQFFKVLIEGLGLDGQGWEERRYNRSDWADLRSRIEKSFKSKTRAEWEKTFDGTDACCTPVLDFREMEGSAEKEGDQRPSVVLRETPCLAVHQGATDPAQGQGAGVSGNGYAGSALYPGKGGEEVLKQWLSWSRGAQFDVEKGGLTLKERSRL
ncbi:putative alpha-methylacyl- racemase protein [Phaeoacremonium minimum UCRPA7]|uniref:Putative alpha-methylacyl-racemase protein n=1 Tax=Phaeoacremonium minimum (strain UCR-PA7) TaxID=1286976 RepID=R8BBN2_PHAM7|nr:putative alpha-methylacyl- racemase protein [Phaeoacremonium minimum UCRPA7]EON96692.1 putative alpha-methylacyl- racemase protein [Phaeoacremonium minimum UCRPA7]